MYKMYKMASEDFSLLKLYDIHCPIRTHYSRESIRIIDHHLQNRNKEAIHRRLVQVQANQIERGK